MNFLTRMKKNYCYLLILVWLLLLALGPIAVFKNPPYQNWLVRSIGLMALIALSTQIFLRVVKWSPKFHTLLGLITALLVLFHPLSLFVFNFLDRKIFDPFYVFTDFCLLCPLKIELYYTLGRLAFWLLGVAVLAACLRKRASWRASWRFVHGLSYLIFFLVSVHAWFVGSDIKTTFFLPIYFGLLALVLAALIISVILNHGPTAKNKRI